MVSSRIVKTRLKSVGCGQRKSGSSRGSSDLTVSVVCAYAPTARAPSEVKSRFLANCRTH